MNYNIACSILNLKPHFTYSELRKNYHVLALQYHPDKNKSKNSEDIFKQIVEAYNYLDEYHNKYMNNVNKYSTTKDVDDTSEISYSKLITDFIKILSTKDIDLLNIFKNDCLEYSLSIINSLDKFNYKRFV